MEFELSDDEVIEANVMEDEAGEYGLYIVPKGAEICITEGELLAAIKAIYDQRSIS